MTPPPYPCAVCRREHRGFAYGAPDEAPAYFCSFECSEVYMQAKRAARPITPNERAAAGAGGKAAGAYLERIGRTDLADLSAEEWAAFCTTLFEGACADLERQAGEAVPF